jgi:ferredoxin-type protein NapF
MAHSVSRARLFRGDLRGDRNVLRPPWSLAEIDFIEACTGCGDCLRACPTQIIQLGRGRLAEVDFARGECLLCGDCARACRSGAIQAETSQRAWPWTAQIGDRCLSLRQVECRSCADVCEPRAIRFTPRTGGIAQPSLHREDCTACGACIHACPTQAIGREPTPNQVNS